MPISSADITRLVRLLGMLGSEHDGEVANAGRLADRLVRELGLTWGEVVQPAIAPPPPPPPPPPPNHAGFAPGFNPTDSSSRAGRQRNYRLYGFAAPQDWNELARDVWFAARGTAPETERGFIEDMMNWHRMPSEKQQKWLKSLARRYRVAI